MVPWPLFVFAPLGCRLVCSRELYVALPSKVSPTSLGDRKVTFKSNALCLALYVAARIGTENVWKMQLVEVTMSLSLHSTAAVNTKYVFLQRKVHLLNIWQRRSFVSDVWQHSISRASAQLMVSTPFSGHTRKKGNGRCNQFTQILGQNIWNCLNDNVLQYALDQFSFNQSTQIKISLGSITPIPV